MISRLANVIRNDITLITANAIHPKVYTTDEFVLTHPPSFLLESPYHELGNHRTTRPIRSKCGR